MNRSLIVAGLLLAPSVVHAQSEPETPLPTVSIYGFARLDMIFDDSKLSNAQFPSFVQSEDISVTGQPNDSELTIHPRLTRLGVRMDKYDLGCDFAADGKIEVDFQAGGSESRELLRMRHGFGQIHYGPLQLLFGQTSDLISPLYPSANSDSLMWNAGNLGDRRPQMRFTVKPKIWDEKGHFRVAAAAMMPNAVDRQDLDQDGDLDGFDASFPMGQILTEVSIPAWTEKKHLVLGASAHGSVEDVGDVDDANPPAGAFDYNEDTQLISYSLSGHLTLPIIDELWLTGEFFYGQNLSDVRGGIGQAINTDDGDEITALGGWAEIGVKPNAHWSGFVGGSMDRPLENEVANGQRSRNMTFFVANRIRPLKPWEIGIEYIYWVTEWQGLEPGIAHRGNLWMALHYDYTLLGGK